MNLQNHFRLQEFFTIPQLQLILNHEIEHPIASTGCKCCWFPKGCHFILFYQMVFRIIPYRLWRCLRENRLNAASWLFFLLKKKLYWHITNCCSLFQGRRTSGLFLFFQFLSNNAYICSRFKNFWQVDRFCENYFLLFCLFYLRKRLLVLCVQWRVTLLLKAVLESFSAATCPFRTREWNNNLVPNRV